MQHPPRPLSGHPHHGAPQLGALGGGAGPRRARSIPRPYAAAIYTPSAASAAGRGPVRSGSHSSGVGLQRRSPTPNGGGGGRATPSGRNRSESPALFTAGHAQLHELARAAVEARSRSDAPYSGAGAGRGPQALTRDILLDSTKATKGSKENVEQFLGRLTHLQLQGLRLGPCLGDVMEDVANATVVYAYDNLLQTLEGCQHLRRLEMLYLQDNRLTSMTGLEGLSQLRKLHLGHNMLTRIEGLQGCTRLEELNVSHQRPAPGAPALALEFCEASMVAVANSLQALDCASNRLTNVHALTCLGGIHTLNLSGNYLHLTPDVRDLLSGDFLTKVNLQGNPLATQERKHRSAVVLISPNIEEIDDRAVLPQERDFVRRLEEQKRKLRAQRDAHAKRHHRSHSSSPVQPSPIGADRPHRFAEFAADEDGLPPQPDFGGERSRPGSSRGLQSVGGMAAAAGRPPSGGYARSGLGGGELSAAWPGSSHSRGAFEEGGVVVEDFDGPGGASMNVSALHSASGRLLLPPVS